MEQAEQEDKLLSLARKNLPGIPHFNPENEIWRTWRQRFTNWTLLTGISDLGREGRSERLLTFAKLTVVSAMKGGAVERVRPFLPGSDIADSCNSLEAYLETLQTIFQPPSESRSLRLDFRSRKQSKDEDVSSYLSSKFALYDIAYLPDQRDHETLLAEVIKGLFSIVVKRRLQQARYLDTREQIRERLFDIVAKEREAYQCGFAESTSLDGLVAVAVPVVKRTDPGSLMSRGGVEPMEIDALKEEIARLQGNAGNNRGNQGGQGGQGGPKVEKRTCFNCKKPGHLKRNCPLPPTGDGGGKIPKKKRRCRHCNCVGHTIEECRKRLADKRAARDAVKNVTEPDDDLDDDEEVGFLGMTRGVCLH